MTASWNSPSNSHSPAALSGLRVLVTRAQNQADELTTRLTKEGATVYAQPLLEFQAPQDCGELDAALRNLPSFDWLIFASKNAVEFTFSRLEKLSKAGELGYPLNGIANSLTSSSSSSSTSSSSSSASSPASSASASSPSSASASSPSSASASSSSSASASSSFSDSTSDSSPQEAGSFPQIAVIGSGTAKALETHNLKAAFIPPAYVAESLIEHLPQTFPLNQKKILWLKTNIGRPLIKTELEKAGATVTAITAYETNLPANSQAIGKHLLDLLQEGKIDVITVASAQTARNLAKVLSQSLAESDPCACANTDSTSSNNSQLTIETVSPTAPQQPSPDPTNSTTGLTLTLANTLAKVKIAAIGPITAKACKENLGKADLVASEYNLDGLVNLLATFQAKNRETLGINKNQITI